MYGILLYILGIVPFGVTFNLSPNFSFILGNEQPNSFFGYSVNLRAGIDGFTPSVVVGAPRANSSIPQHSAIPEPGAIYQCSINDIRTANGITCQRLLLDPSGEIQGYQGFIFRHWKHHSWLGAAIDGRNDRGGQFVACAPRWANQHNMQIHENLYANGFCYLLPDTTDVNRTAEQLIPLLNPNLQVINSRVNYYGYAFGEAGFSIHLPKGDELLLGAPGLYHWKGGIIWYKNRLRQEPIIPNTAFMRQIRFDSYFGYTVNSGQFRRGLKTYYIASAPRDSMYNGRVFLFDLRDDTQGENIQIMKELVGQQMGEYFGSSLCVTDVNGDGLDDIFVGAPRHAISSELDKSGDEGAVYVFINTDFWEFQEPVKLEFVYDPGSQFGTCISSLGDIDHDGFNDIVVGAPYEDEGRGAIYIYLGSQRGLQTQYSQHIRARDTQQTLRGFGISLSRGIDIDGNRYPDIAVGAYKSGNVVLFRSQPVARLSAQIIPDAAEIDLDTKEFQINICLLYEGSDVPEQVEVDCVLNVDPVYKRAAVIVNGNFSQRSQFQVSVSFGQQRCMFIPVWIRKLNQDFSKPIEFTMHFKLEESNITKNEFCAECPVLSPQNKNSASAFVPYSTGCGNDNICTPDLILGTQPLSSFVIGSSTSLPLKLAISNIGEPAFLVRLLLSMPPYLTLLSIPSFCNELAEGPINCELGNLVTPDDIKLVALDLDTSKIDGNAMSLELSLSVSSAGNEQNELDNYLNLTLPLLRQAQLIIYGKSMPEQFQYENKNLQLDVMTIIHEFDIRNLGPSPITTSKIKFYFPVLFNKKTVLRVMEPETFLGTQSFRCVADNPGFYAESHQMNNMGIREKRESNIHRGLRFDSKFGFPSNRTLFLNCSDGDSDLIQCMVVTCTIGLLEDLSEGATIKFLLETQLNEIEDVLNEKDITHIEVLAFVEPQVKVDTETHGAAFFILGTTLIGSLPEPRVPVIWYFLATILGLLVLLLIVAGLTKWGFFKRKTRSDLKQLKQQLVLNEVQADCVEDVK